MWYELIMISNTFFSCGYKKNRNINENKLILYVKYNSSQIIRHMITLP